MTLSVEEALEGVYESLANGNQDIDLNIQNLKTALAAVGEAKAVVDPQRLVQNNRAGRKMMQSYFKKRGVVVEFSS